MQTISNNACGGRERRRNMVDLSGALDNRQKFIWRNSWIIARVENEN